MMNTLFNVWQQLRSIEYFIVFIVKEPDWLLQYYVCTMPVGIVCKYITGKQICPLYTETCLVTINCELLGMTN